MQYIYCTKHRIWSRDKVLSVNGKLREKRRAYPSYFWPLTWLHLMHYISPHLIPRLAMSHLSLGHVWPLTWPCLTSHLATSESDPLLGHVLPLTSPSLTSDLTAPHPLLGHDSPLIWLYLIPYLAMSHPSVSCPLYALCLHPSMSYSSLLATSHRYISYTSQLY